MIDTLRFKFKRQPTIEGVNFKYLDTDYGKVRVFDTGGQKPVIVSVPDGPNVIEHHLSLIADLSSSFRVVCFEFPGVGYSFPNANYDYSYQSAAKLTLQIMDMLDINQAVLAYSCSNGLYAIKASELSPDRITRLILAQTPSVKAMQSWTVGTIPKLLTYPLIGELLNSFSEEKLAKVWYKYALPKEIEKQGYIKSATHSLQQGGCFCLAGLVQGMRKAAISSSVGSQVPATMIWGDRDFTHRNTDASSISEHLPNCEIITFDDCGHFPDLENSNKYARLLKERC